MELAKLGIDALHVSDLGFERASDQEIIELSREKNLVIVTLDADFHALISLSGQSKPSVIRIRIEGLKAVATAHQISTLVSSYAESLGSGCLLSVSESRVASRRLPISSLTSGNLKS